jgi:hypothetical protein
VTWHEGPLQRKSKISHPNRGQSGHLEFRIASKSNNFSQTIVDEFLINIVPSPAVVLDERRV